MHVVAIVAQHSEKVRRYLEANNLPFNLLVDHTRETVKAYGVWHPVGFDAWNIARPALFLIDRAGIIRYSFVASSQFEFPTHEEILEQITALAARQAGEQRPAGAGAVNRSADRG